MSKLKYILTSILLIIPTIIFAADYGSFADYYVVDTSWGFWTWFFIIAGAIIAAGAAFFTGGTSVPVYITTIGTALGFTGASAIVAGVLICGLVTDVAITYSIDTALEIYEMHCFEKASLNMTNLPMMQNENNGKERIYEQIKDTIDPKKNLIEQKDKIERLFTNNKCSRPLDAAVFAFQMNDYTSAKQLAVTALNSDNIRNKALASFIYAVSSLYDENVNFDSTLKYFNYAMAADKDNPIPLLCYAILLDRGEYLLCRNAISVDDFAKITESLKYVQHHGKQFDLIKLAIYTRGVNILTDAIKSIKVISKDGMDIPGSSSVLWKKHFVKNEMITFLEGYNPKFKDEKVAKLFNEQKKKLFAEKALDPGISTVIVYSIRQNLWYIIGLIGMILMIFYFCKKNQRV